MSELNQSSKSEQHAGAAPRPITPEQAEMLRKQAIAQCMKKYGVPQVTKQQFESMTAEQKQEYRRRYAAAQAAAKPMLDRITAAVVQPDNSQKQQAGEKASPAAAPVKRKAAPKKAGKEKAGAKEPRKASKQDKPKDPAKRKKITLIVSIAAAVVLVFGGLFGLVYTGYLDILPVKYHTYEVADNDTLLQYLKHPSLRAGDTLNLASSFTVDVQEDLGGYAILPLVNYGGSGSVNFTGGTVVLAGGADSCSMNNVSFSDCDVYIDAPATDISWSNASGSAKVNAKSLNGSASLSELDLLCVGAKTTIPVTIENVSGSSLTNVQVKFTSASCVFTEGETYEIPEIAAGGSVTAEVPVILTEAGRVQIIAYGTDESGNTLLLGKSDYVNVAGDGYYAGDIHTHTEESVFKREGTMEGNITNAYDHGMSFIFSQETRESEEEEAQKDYEEWLVEDAERKKAEKEEARRKAEEEAAAAENGGDTTGGGTTEGGDTSTGGTTPEGGGTDTSGSGTPAEGASLRGSFSLPVMMTDEEEEDSDTLTSDEILAEITKRGEEYIAERVDQSKVDSLTGSTNAFLQIPAIETGRASRHMLIYGATVAPSSGYGVVSPYTTKHNDTGQWTYQDAIYEVTDAGGLVILPHFFKDGELEGNLSMAKSVYGITAIEYLSAEMLSTNTECQIEYNIWNNYNVQGRQRVYVVMSSNAYTSQDVGLQYIKGHLSSLTEENCVELLRSGEFIATNGPEVRFTLGGHVMGSEISLAQESGTMAKARFYVSDDTPLTNVTLYCYEITGLMEDLEPEIVFSEDFTGKGVYSHTGEIDVELKPNCFYRVEVHSESNNRGDDIGIGLSNPIWVAKQTSLKNTTMLEELNYMFGGEVKQAPNGTYYIEADHFTTNMLNVKTDGKYTDIAYHEYNSDLMADKVTVLITASDTTQTIETIYIV